jgi:hypothetical protein
VVGAACGYYHCLAYTVGGKLYQWGKLHRHIEGPSTEYFGMAIGLSGLGSERMKRMVDRSHSAYYAGAAPIPSIHPALQRWSREWGRWRPVAHLRVARYVVFLCSAGATGAEIEELSRVQNFGSFTPYTQPVPEPVTALQHVKVRHLLAQGPMEVMCSGGVSHHLANRPHRWWRWQLATRFRWPLRRRANVTAGASTKSANWASAIATTRVRAVPPFAVG